MTAMGNAARRKCSDPRRGVDPGAKQSVRGKGAGKGERVRDEQQRREDEARGQDGQGSRPKDGGLGVEQGGGDQVADEHDGVDHRDERIDLAQANVAHRQDEEEGDEQQADDGETEPDLPAGPAAYRTAPGGPATRPPPRRPTCVDGDRSRSACPGRLARFSLKPSPVNTSSKPMRRLRPRKHRRSKRRTAAEQPGSEKRRRSAWSPGCRNNRHR